MSSAIASTMAHAGGFVAHAEEEVRQITVLSNFRAKKNLRLPIFRLPPEILTIIFVHGARSYHESDDGGRLATHIPSWVNVSYVCSYWRNVALNCPVLWTYHFNVSRRWTEELLLRSKEASLKISYCPKEEASRWMSSLDSLLEHSNRIQEFRLDVLLPFLPKKLFLRAPRLEKLEMSFLQEIPRQSVTIVDGDKLPLHTLRLINCPLPWYLFNLSGLNMLSLHHVHPPSPPNVGEFLTILNSMRNLTVLHLEDILPGAHGFLSSGGLAKIHLPRLALLAIVAPLSTIIALLSCINIPAETRFYLKPRFEPGSSVSDYSPLSSLLAQHFSTSRQQSSSSPVFHSLEISDAHDGALTFGSLRHDYDPCTPLSEEFGHNSPLEIIFGEEATEWEGSQGMTECDRHHIMSDICRSLPLNDVQTLHIIQPEFASDIWEEILGHLDGLRYMKLNGGCMPNLSVLFSTPHEPKESPDGHDWNLTSGRILAPALEELVLDDVHFMSDEDADVRYWSEKSLLDAVSTRKGLRDRLVMIECEVWT